MEKTTYFPFYYIYSDIVKVALGVKDNRAVVSKLRTAKIKIRVRGRLKFIKTEDILSMIEECEEEDSMFPTYRGKGNGAKLIDDLE